MKRGSANLPEILERQVERVLPSREGLRSLMKKRRIRLYLGVDPTGKDLHLGHAIALRKLRQFSDLGHEAILVVGTGTVLAGDPSQRATARPSITEAEIKKNMKTWEKQASQILDFSRIKMRFNGDWLLRLNLADILRIASHVSAAQLFQRDMFQNRLKQGDTVWTHELLYPLLQGYDSVAMDVDLEIGGADQLFNMLIGRELQKKMRGKEKYALTVPMLMGLDGKPMSKTSGNTVNILDSPQEMYGKLMSLKDDLVSHYFELCTEVPFQEVENLPSLEAKARLSLEIVSLYHGKEAAGRAEREFSRVFREKREPSRIPDFKPKKASLSLLEIALQTGFARSKADARRLIKQGGLKVDRVAQNDPDSVVRMQEGMVLQAGKRRFFRVTKTPKTE